MNYEKNIKILNDFEKALQILGNDQPVDFKIENSDGELKKVSKEEFARWMEERKDIKTSPKERLIYGASGDIDGITYFVEIKSKNGIVKESYYQPRSEEEKQQIKKRQEINRKRREQEESQNKNFPNSNKQDYQSKEDTNQQQDQSQKIENKDNHNKNIYYGVGLVCLLLLVISVAAVWVKKKK